MVGVPHVGGKVIGIVALETSRSSVGPVVVRSGVEISEGLVLSGLVCSGGARGLAMVNLMLLVLWLLLLLLVLLLLLLVLLLLLHNVQI